jgi:hypothetical protein
MAYREVAVFEVREVLRLWLALLAFRRIAEMVRCDRKTVTKIVRIAEGHGLVQTDSPDRLTDDFVGGVMAELAPKVPDRHGEAWNVLVGHREKLEGWRNDDVPAKKMVELLKRDGVVVPERTLNRYLAAEFGSPERSTVPVVDGEPGVELQVDFGELGRMFDEETGKKRRVWALVFTAGVSRHTFVWLSFNQNLATVIDGCEAAWQFFGGVFRVLVPDLCRPRDYADFAAEGGALAGCDGVRARHSCGLTLRLSPSEPFGSVKQGGSRWAPFHGHVAVRR